LEGDELATGIHRNSAYLARRAALASFAETAEKNVLAERGSVGGRLSFLPPPEGWWVSRKDF